MHTYGHCIVSGWLGSFSEGVSGRVALLSGKLFQFHPNLRVAGDAVLAIASLEPQAASWKGNGFLRRFTALAD